MKLDYIDNVPADGPIIRLYNFTNDEIRQLYDAVKELSTGDSSQIDVHELPYVQPIEGCQLSFGLCAWDQAVIRKSESKNEFDCRFTTGTWENIANLMEPFVKGSSEFQWLAGVPGEASILLSPSGFW
jgi:hypothetical protein